MTTQFNIDLTINMPDGGRHARQLLNLYFSDMPADIKESGLKLCNGDEALQARKFSKLNVKRSDVWVSPEGSLKIFIRLSIYSEDAEFVKQAISAYIAAFPDYLKKAIDVYFPHSDYLPESSLQLTDWTVEVVPA